MSRALIFVNGGWQIVTTGQTFSASEVNTEAPELAVLESFSVADLLKLSDRSQIQMPSRPEKRNVCQAVLANWSSILQATPVVSHKKPLRAEVLSKAFSLGLKHISVFNEKTQKFNKVSLEKSSIDAILHAIEQREASMTNSIHSSAVSDSECDDSESVAPSVTALPYVSDLSFINELQEQLTPRGVTSTSPRYHTPRGGDAEVAPIARILRKQGEHTMMPSEHLESPVTWQDVQDESARIIQNAVRIYLLKKSIPEPASSESPTGFVKVLVHPPGDVDRVIFATVHADTDVWSLKNNILNVLALDQLNPQWAEGGHAI